MHRDTNHRVDETPAPLPTQSAQRPRPVRRRAIGIVALVLLALVASTVEVFAGVDVGISDPGSPTQATTTVGTYQESSGRIKYNGRWANATYSGYSGARARGSIQRDAGATFTFTGKSVSWVGPVGPTRGSAKVYLDGTYVKTVSTYASRFIASKTLYSKAFTASGTHTLRIVIQATTGHPMVAIDKFTVSTTSTSSAPVGPATTGTTVTVASIPALLSALDNNNVGQIIVKNGTYRISPSNQTASNSLWIGGRFADRTRPILVRAESRGGVVFDGGGGSSFGGLSFEDGAHHQTWDGFTFANMAATETGIIEVGGYVPRRAPHNIIVRNIVIKSSCTGRATSASGRSWDHGIYIAHALRTGPYTLRFENITVDGRGGLASAVHFYHSASGAPNASSVVVRGLHVTGTQQAVILWDSTMRNITIDDVDVNGALGYAVRYEGAGSTGIVLSNITTRNSGYQGFYSTQGSRPAGVKFINNSFH
jgi:hypothetical protein